MYKNIMLPVDLAHVEKLTKAVAVGADLAKHYGASITAVAVTTSTPSDVAHSPAEFSEILDKFAADQGTKHGVEISAQALVSSDPAIDLDETLAKEAARLECDLVVMRSHVPGFAEYIFASRAGYLASHSDLSVFVVR